MNGARRPTRRALPVRRVPARVARDVFTSLGQLLTAGVSVVEALHMLAGTARADLRTALKRVASRVESGSSFAQAARGAPTLFEDADIGLLEAFETIGDMPGAFGTLADGRTERLTIRRQLVRGLTYPTVVIVAHAFLGPLPKIVIGPPGAYGGAVVLNLLAIAVVLAVVGFVIPAALRTPRMRALAWRVGWPAAAYVAHVRTLFCRALSRALAAGLDVGRALRAAGAATGDATARTAAGRGIIALRSGSELAPLLLGSKLVGGDESMLLTSAERAGTLPKALDTIAERYADRRARGVRAAMMTVGAVLTLIVVVVVVTSIMGAYDSMARGTDDLLKQLDGGALLPIP